MSVQQNQQIFAMNEPNSQAANSPHSSSSTVSEPPDIRNWFSSYTYQTPILESNELFGDSSRFDEEGRGLYVEDSENEEEEDREDLTRVRKSHQSGICARSVIRKRIEVVKNHGHNLSLVEVPAYADSLSFPSEPPDIRNWFSSYVYESPTLDSSDFDISLLRDDDFGNIQESDKTKRKSSKENRIDEELPLFNEASLDGYATTRARFIRTDGNKGHHVLQEKDDSESGALCSNEILGPDRESDQGTQGAAPKSGYSIEIVCADRASDHDPQGGSPKSSGIIAKNSIEVPRVKAVLLPILHDGQQTSSTHCSRTSANAPSMRKEGESEIKDETASLASENDSGWISPYSKSREPLRKTIKTIYERHLLAKDGQTLLNKKTSPMLNDENSPRQLGPSNCNHDGNAKRVPSNNRKSVAVKRAVLKETTNFLHPCKMEVAGKWRCPQKSKPNTGPPLKQLRLEKWVQRL